MSHATGLDVLHNAATNKSTAFTAEERDRLKLRGLLPPAICSQAVQVRRALENLRRKADDIEKYIFLQALVGRNERLFYRLVLDHIEEILPLIYTPTVGQACKEFANIFRQTRGLYVTAEDRGRAASLLDNWPHRDVRAIVMTDGERILGLGDLGASGMGIPIGKLSLYSALAGIPPEKTLPIMLDVGTNNEALRQDPLYLGLGRARLSGDEYFELFDELIGAIVDAYPKALLQFEDFATPNAYALLARYRHRLLCFNDDIQGTAAVAVAGVYASTRISGFDFEDLRIMFLGAGSAATGIADLLTVAFEESGLSRSAARERLWFVDRGGLLTSERHGLQAHNLPYAHQHAPADFLGAIDSIRPHVLIGATGTPGTFTRTVVERMAQHHQRPTIFALSNPTSHAECTAAQAYEWSDGRAIFASGSPFAALTVNGTTFRPSQSNNAYIFPGVGLGAIFAYASTVTDSMFLASARTLASSVLPEHLRFGSLFPPLTTLRSLSLSIATQVAAEAFQSGVAQREQPGALQDAIQETMYDPTY